MESVEDFQFDLVRHHGDYVEFSVSFKIEYNKWTAEGIGWITHKGTSYYLRFLKLNNWPAGNHYNKKAKITLRRQSYKFNSETLDRLAITNITHHLK
jgi:hypothetical protein